MWHKGDKKLKAFANIKRGMKNIFDKVAEFINVLKFPTGILIKFFEGENLAENVFCGSQPPASYIQPTRILSN